jgi:hypothetical protein
MWVGSDVRFGVVRLCPLTQAIVDFPVFEDTLVRSKCRLKRGKSTPRQEIEAGKGAENGKAPVLNEEPGALALGSISTSMVELVGLEPTTSAVPRRRSPS